MDTVPGTKAKPSQSVNSPTYRYQVYQEIDIVPHSTQSGETAVKSTEEACIIVYRNFLALGLHI